MKIFFNPELSFDSLNIEDMALVSLKLFRLSNYLTLKEKVHFQHIISLKFLENQMNTSKCQKRREYNTIMS